MTERAYTVAELDALRCVVEHKFLYGQYRERTTRQIQAHCWSRPYREEDRLATIEQQVRTHMLAGNTAQDLIDSEVSVSCAVDSAPY